MIVLTLVLFHSSTKSSPSCQKEEHLLVCWCNLWLTKLAAFLSWTLSTGLKTLPGLWRQEQFVLMVHKAVGVELPVMSYCHNLFLLFFASRPSYKSQVLVCFYPQILHFWTYAGIMLLYSQNRVLNGHMLFIRFRKNGRNVYFLPWQREHRMVN